MSLFNNIAFRDFLPGKLFSFYGNSSTFYHTRRTFLGKTKTYYGNIVGNCLKCEVVPTNQVDKVEEWLVKNILSNTLENTEPDNNEWGVCASER